MSTHKKSIAYGLVNTAFTPSQCRSLLKKSGTSGTLAFDIRRHTKPKNAITEIAHQYGAATSSIARKGSALNTQSIARATSQISTQSITHAKASNSILSILSLGTLEGLGANIWIINLTNPVDTDTVAGDPVVIASATSGGNNGTFTILEVNRGGGNNLVVQNASGVAQTSAAGNAQLKIMSYNFTNPVNANFVAGLTAVFASHTNAANDGTKTIYKVNEAGNNIWVKSATGVTQGGAAGTADTNVWIFALSGAAPADYVVSETARTTSHSNGLNDAAALQIVAVNSGGNNLYLHNSVGVTQGGVAGNINTNRFIYNLPSDPTSQISIGQNVFLSGHTNPLNDGSFVVKDISSNSLTIYNIPGVAQGGTTGNVYSARKLIKFAIDQSANYTTDSYVEMAGCAADSYNSYLSVSPFKVLEVNRGGGANYNIVVENFTAESQVGGGGYVQIEMKSIFSVAPSLASEVTGLIPDQNLVGLSSDLLADLIPQGTPLLLYITSLMNGDPRDLTVTLI